ncbi:MAG: YqjK family protein [Acidiferrobacterales bacterium]
MRAALSEVVRRRQDLVARACEQRMILVASARGVGNSIVVADRAFRIGQVLRRHPVSLAAVMALLLWTGGRRAYLWGGPSIALWKLFRTCGGQGARCARHTEP